jgi:hypothetical protein
LRERRTLPSLAGLGEKPHAPDWDWLPLTPKMARMSEIVFLIEHAPEGGLMARALGHSIFTEADTYEELRAHIRDAVRVHFDEADRPTAIIEQLETQGARHSGESRNPF